MFWPRYISALALGTAAVYFLAPPVWERLRQPSPEPLFGEDYAEDFPSGDALPFQPVPAVHDTRAFGGVRKITARPRRQPATASAQSGATAACPQPSEAQEDEPLSLDSIPQSSPVIMRWGVLTVNGPVYKKDGKKLQGKAPGGFLVEIAKTVFTSRGDEMALCSVWSGGKWSAQCLVPTSNIAMFEGTRDGLYASDVANLMEYFRLNSALAERKARMEGDALRANPYSARLLELNAENRRMAARAKELVKRRDAATGPERNRLADELRRMEKDSARISGDLKSQLELYENWKTEHGVKPVIVEDDPECRDILAKIRAAEPGVAMFGLHR